MNHFKLLLCLATIFLFIAACAKQAEITSQNTANKTVANIEPMVATAPPDEFASSRKIFKEQNCVKCHKEDGSGGATEIDGTKFKTPDLRSERMKNAKDADFISTIENGEDEMPGYKAKIKPEEIKELVRFIRVEVQRK